MSIEMAAPNHPFNHIALSLSGGGVRAVGYHLGTLDYLHRSNLLRQVHTLSSVSGGSLIGIGYALSLKKGESFQEFFDNICEFLPELNTIEDLFSVLARRDPPVASGSRTLITALSQVYREKYLGRYYKDPETGEDPKFGMLCRAEPAIHLKDIIFNATEFKTGFAFRFQISPFGNSVGNARVRIKDEHAKQIQMADIMAASSCIPGGMEPFSFPQDFHWERDEWRSRGRSTRPVCDEVEAYLSEKDKGVTTVPLMDGGVYDNQGITSIILTLVRRHDAEKHLHDETFFDAMSVLEPIRPRDWARWLLGNMENTSDVEKQKDMGDVDLFIVSDTPVFRDPLYEVKKVEAASRRGFKGWLRRRTVGSVDAFIGILSVLLGLSIAQAILIALPLVTNEFPVMRWFFILEIVFLSLLLIGGFAVFWLLRRKAKKAVRDMAKGMPSMKKNLWAYAKRLRMGQLWDMTTLRASSMTALTARIFMNRIRQLGYSLLYSHEEFERRVMDNNINDVDSITTGGDDSVPAFVKTPSKEVRKVVKKAANMGTKLWISKPADDKKPHDLDILIAAGQISTCFNVIEYLWQFHRDEKGELSESVRELFEFAKADWMRFSEDAFWLLKLRKQAGRESGVLFWQSTAAQRRRLFGSLKRRRQPV